MSSVVPEMQGFGAAVPPGPMTVGRILDRVWAILRGNIGLFLKLGSVPAAAMLLVYAIVFGSLWLEGLLPARPAEHPDTARMLWTIFPSMLVAMVPMMLAYALYQAAACHAAIEAHRGTAVTWRAAYAMAWSDAVRYVWLMILQALCVAAPVLVLFAAVAGLMGLSELGWKGGMHPGALFVLIPLILLGYLLAMVYAVWMMLRLGLAFPACVTENITAVGALKRSGALTHQAKGRMFLVLLVVYAISYGAFMVLEMVLFALIAVVALVASGMHLSFAAGTTGFGIAGGAFAALFFAWTALIWAAYAISLSVLYEDQLLRIDGPAANALPHRVEPA